MHNNSLLTSREAFLRALELRFAPFKFKDPIATLCKLSQTQSLQEYIFEFESLANWISRIPLTSTLVVSSPVSSLTFDARLLLSNLPICPKLWRLRNSTMRKSKYHRHPFPDFPDHPKLTSHLPSPLTLNQFPLFFQHPHPNYLSGDLRRPKCKPVEKKIFATTATRNTRKAIAANPSSFSSQWLMTRSSPTHSPIRLIPLMTLL